MKYKKGSFIVIPNKEQLKGKPSEMQAIYLWICDHSNDDGECFPSRNKIAQEAGCGIRTVDKYLKQLVEDGFLIIEPRKKKGTKENTSNLYQLMIINALPSVEKDTTPSVEKDAVTIPNINHTNLTITPPRVEVPIKEVKQFSFEEEMKKLESSSYKPHKIIHLFIVRKGWRFDNQKQWKAQIGRWIKPAQLLEGYSGRDIDEAILYCDKEYKDFNWGLETVLKIIPNIANKR